MKDSAGKAWITVWDPLLRFGHWALVAGFTIAYLTGEEEREPSDWHEWAGYAVGAIVVWRVLWGLVGPQHARFSDFVVGPRGAIAYLFGLVSGHTRRYLGHSPAGGVMVVALLSCLALTVATGIIADPDGMGSPASVTATAVTQAPAAERGKDLKTVSEKNGEGQESLIGEAHAVLANITLFLAILHILGVALASFVHRENLVAAMITGKKRADEAVD